MMSSSKCRITHVHGTGFSQWHWKTGAISLAVRSPPETCSHQVFLVDVWVSGRHLEVERRYTEFEELHKQISLLQIKKMIKTPEFPPKKVLKWSSKVLEQRRLALETYLQGAVACDPIPKPILQFLEVLSPVEGMDMEKTDSSYTPMHQTIVSFPEDAFLQDIHRGTLPDIVAEGVTIGLFDSDYNAFPS